MHAPAARGPGLQGLRRQPASLPSDTSFNSFPNRTMTFDRTARSPARSALVFALLACTIGVASAQTTPEDIRPQIASARLGAGYAQMINLAATPDLSAASYRIDEDDSRPTLDVFRAPYQARWFALSPDADLYWRIAGGYLAYKDSFAFDPSPAESGKIRSTWSAYSLSAGLMARISLGQGFTLEPALDLALARLDNSARYEGAASALKPILDGLLFNWNTDAWLATPSLALAWSAGDAAGRTTVRGHVARSWISSFDETDPVQSFDETANIYSLRAEYAKPSDLHAFGRPLHWVVYGGYAGFFGANRDALGFDGVAEIGGGLELPLRADRASERVRLAAGYLRGSNVSGWTIGLSLQY